MLARLAGQNHQGGDRDDGHLDDDGAERQKQISRFVCASMPGDLF
jgi:hypothetical protein